MITLAQLREVWETNVKPHLWIPPGKSCWEYQGTRDRDGYGVVRLATGEPIATHRVSMCLRRGKVYPNGIFACHTCDNPPCCNPDHLFPGTVQENNADKDRKGRTAKGEAVASSKLTMMDVEAMRSLRATEGLTYAELAAMFGVSETAVRMACKGETWKPSASTPKRT